MKNYDLHAELKKYEIFLLSDALVRARGNKTEAAKLLNISFRQIRYLIEKHNLQP